jgi:hypothetical protein
MISQRTSGLYHLVVLVQCLLISILYWTLVTTFYCYHTSFSLEGYRVYAIPYAFALIGLLAAAALRTDALLFTVNRSARSDMSWHSCSFIS